METDSVQNMRDHQLKNYWLVCMKEMNLFSSFQSSRSLLYSRKPDDIYNSTQDDVMTEDIFILDCHSEIFVCVGQQVDSKSKLLALTIGEEWFIRLKNSHQRMIRQQAILQGIHQESGLGMEDIWLTESKGSPRTNPSATKWLGLQNVCCCSKETSVADGKFLGPWLRKDL